MIAVGEIPPNLRKRDREIMNDVAGGELAVYPAWTALTGQWISGQPFWFEEPVLRSSTGAPCGV